MRVVAVSMVRNERDIVEAFVRHNAAFVDAHLILDQGSTDGTGDILRALVDEGFDVLVERDSRPGYYQAERTTRLMRRAVTEFDADWVVPIDADEFIVAPSRRALRRTLARRDGAVTWSWLSFVPRPEDDLAEVNVVIRLRHRVEEAVPVEAKVLVPAAVAATATLLQGNHDLAEEELRTGGRLDGVALAHFPVRNPEQLAVKVTVSTLQYLARGERHDWGHHYLEPFEVLTHGWDQFVAAFHDQALRFPLRPGEPFEGTVVEDPIVYAGRALRYTDGMRSGEPFKSVLEYAHDLAERYGRGRSAEPFSAEATDE